MDALVVDRQMRSASCNSAATAAAAAMIGANALGEAFMASPNSNGRVAVAIASAMACAATSRSIPVGVVLW